MVPFWYVQHFRYYRGIKVFAYFFGDLLPILIYCYLFWESFSGWAFFWTWVFFWSFYEIGYLVNDCFAARRESRPSMYAPPEIAGHFWLVVAFRAAVAMLVGGWLVSEYAVRLEVLGVFTLLTLGVFAIHNRLKDYRERLVTLFLLGLLKPLFIPAVFEVALAPLVVVFLPSLLVKCFAYVHDKGFGGIDLRRARELRAALVTGGTLIVLAVDIRLLFAYLPILLITWAIFFYEGRQVGDAGQAAV